MFPWMNPIFYPKLPEDYDLPPTVYAICNAIVNFDSEDPKKIKDLASYARETIFDFSYPLSEKISRQDFEEMILKKFMMRRIGFETVTAFKMQLDVKLNEIMPVYNKMFDALENWSILEDGETTTTVSTSNVSTNTNMESDRRYSETPQNKIQQVKDGTYLSDYNFDTTGSNSTSEGENREIVSHSPSDKIRVYNEFMNQRNGIYTMIFNDLEELFYFLV